MQEQAIAKLQAEMDANKAHPYIQVVGKFLIDRVEKNPDEAKMIVASDKKTIKGALMAMRAAAQKKAFEGMAMISDSDGFTVALKYFGIDLEVTDEAAAAVVAQTTKGEKPKPPAPPKPPEKTVESKRKLSVSLDDFL